MTPAAHAPPKAERETDPRCQKYLARKYKNGNQATSRWWFNAPVGNAEQGCPQNHYRNDRRRNTCQHALDVVHSFSGPAVSIERIRTGSNYELADYEEGSIF